ncbi:hypothetical protein A9495_10565 [Brachyspira hampsonii]|nr:hypothetical protein A9495_10565 [Brachyspira hampsonii]
MLKIKMETQHYIRLVSKLIFYNFVGTSPHTPTSFGDPGTARLRREAKRLHIYILRLYFIQHVKHYFYN